MNIVIIEWDGDKPPTTWYNRLRKKYGLHVRGDKELSPLERRRTQDGSVIVQEAVIICASDTLAVELAILANELGAKSVRRSQDVEINDFMATKKDVEIHEKIEAIFSKKGRPSGEKQDFTVLCLEEMKSFVVKEQHYIATCPNCSGLNIKTWVGEPHGYANPNTGDMIVDWVRMRFATGAFYIADSGVDVPPDIANINITNSAEKKIADLIQKSDKLKKAFAKLGEPTAFRIMDSIISARVYQTYEKRRGSRVECCVYCLQRGATSSEINLAEDDNSVDLMDASAIITPAYCGSLWLATK